MNSIGDGVDEFPDDAAATRSHAALENKLDIEKSARSRISGFPWGNIHSRKERHLIRPWAKRTPSENYGFAKYTWLERSSIPIGSTDAMLTSIDNIEGADGATMRYRAWGLISP